MLRLLQIACLTAAVLTGTAVAQDFDHSHKDFSDVLTAYVVVSDNNQRSTVKYAELAKDRAPLDSYLDSLSAVRQAHYQNWTHDQQLAFLINAYNGFTLQLIIDNYDAFASGDASSIRDLGGFFSTPWEKSFFTLLGEKRHLDWVEHDTIRADFDEPRIHAALVCAAMSCPKLRAEAFTAGQLDVELEEQMQLFLADRSKNGMDEQGIYLSKIFDWYAEDFGDIQTYLKQYDDALTDTATYQQRLETETLNIRYTNYDWALNANN